MPIVCVGVRVCGQVCVGVCGLTVLRKVSNEKSIWVMTSRVVVWQMRRLCVCVCVCVCNK